MSLASTVPSPANRGTHCYTHFTNPSSFKLNTNPKFTYNPCRSKPCSIISQVSSDNTNIETTQINPSMAHRLKPCALDTKPPTNDAHNLNQGLSTYKTVWVTPSELRTSVITPERARGRKIHTWTPQIAMLRLFAKKLDLCEPTQEAIFKLVDSFEETLTPRDAMVIMNNINGWKKGYFFFKRLNKNEDFQTDSVIYNVTMKVLRRGRQWDKVEELLQDMLGKGIQPDNVTYSTVISCARVCNVPHKAVEWFGRMSETGCVPDEVTYTAMIDAYSRAGKVQEALNLYERARADGWRPDMKAFTTLLKMYNISKDLNGALSTFKDMEALGVNPNLVAYNIMFDTLAKVGKPSVAKALFREMKDAGLKPDQVTVGSLLRIYSKAKWADDALKLWEKMKQEGWRKDLLLYNKLLSMCANIGRVEDAAKLFKEMCQSDNCKPDIWSYTSMVHAYTIGGQIEEANRMFDKMMEAGFRPTVMVCTCLIQCYGREKRFDDVVRTFNLLLDEGTILDEKFCATLLWILTLCEKEELGKVFECIEKANPKLGLVLKMLQEEDLTLAVLQEELQIVFNQASNKEIRSSIWNSLIDLCYKFNFPKRAHNLLFLGKQFGIYRNLDTKSPTEWCLDLRSLSFKAALTAFDDWITSLSKTLENGEEMPPSLGIQTGHGRSKHPSDQALVALFGSHLKELNSPFEKSTERVGYFLATSDTIIPWLMLLTQT